LKSEQLLQGRLHFQNMESISCVCREVDAASTWLEYQLRKLATAVPTHLQDSQEAVASFKEMGALHLNVILFTADATAMYTNIEPDLGNAAVQGWLVNFESELPEKIPSIISIW
jgi:hypothetical protein